MMVCSTGHLYHYLMRGEADLDQIPARGLQPLSARPDDPRWMQLERVLPGLHRAIYELFAAPVLQRPYTHSGIFLTPIDFRRMPDLPMGRMARIAVPLAAVDPATATLTYELVGQRVVLPLSAENLAATAALWPAAMVRAWFGRDPHRVFFYVPQVAAYPEGGIPIRPEWVQGPITPG